MKNNFALARNLLFPTWSKKNRYRYWIFFYLYRSTSFHRYKKKSNIYTYFFRPCMESACPNLFRKVECPEKFWYRYRRICRSIQNENVFFFSSL